MNTAIKLGLNGVSEDDIARLVEEFYARIRADAVLGRSSRALPGDWGPHLATMRSFCRR